ncbi:unnamed protein product, partial [Schistosoma margrebowiei]
NPNKLNKSEPTTQTQYTNTIKDVIQSKENKPGQPYSISCFTNQSNCFCHIYEMNSSKVNHNNNELYPCNSICKHDPNHSNNETSLFTDSSVNFNQLKSNMKINNKLPYRSNTFHIKSSNDNHSIQLKHTTYSHHHHHHYVKHCPSSSLSSHSIPVHSTLPFTLKHLSTIRNIYEQNEYSTKIDNKNYINNNELSNNEDQSESDSSSSSSFQLSSYDRPRFYSSNMILLKPPNHHPYMKLKYITEQILLAKSVFDVNQSKKRSNSWSVHRGFNLNSCQSLTSSAGNKLSVRVRNILLLISRTSIEQSLLVNIHFAANHNPNKLKTDK